MDLLAYLPYTKSVVIRDVASGDGVQADLTINTKRGSVTIRLLAQQPIRVTDLRQRDKRARRKAGVVQVPFADR